MSIEEGLDCQRAGAAESGDSGTWLYMFVPAVPPRLSCMDDM